MELLYFSINATVISACFLRTLPREKQVERPAFRVDGAVEEKAERLRGSADVAEK